MKKRFLSPLYDFVFAEIFGNQRNIENTERFLKTLLDIPKDDYDRLTVVSPFIRKFSHKGKMGIVDLKLNTKSGRIIHIELQVDKTINMRNRILYYMSRLIGDQLRWGEDYNKLHQVISIVICDHNLLEEEDYYMNEYELRNRKNNSFTKMIKLITLELPKLTETDDSPVWPWLSFLKCQKEEEVKMLAKNYPYLEDLFVSIKNMGLIGMIRDLQFHKNLWKVDARMREEYVRTEGLKQGLQEGIEKGSEKCSQYVIDLINQGLPIEEIKQRLQTKQHF